ncbi:neoverrucotoxin subunit alpha-like [Bradysia coprophila]|uniref:neoverrucotoxin subunit alpha-like n=1 Tax=Bradysia coprophila TaxID=38358 RepID=UPI00187D9BA0|nr:neoverrucotoxin subunit alpha-like [Bradysia coprophila]
MQKLLLVISLLVGFLTLSSSQSLDLLVEPVTVSALGRVAKIGELYDARTDQFVRISLMTSVQNASQFIHFTHNKHSNIKYLMLDTLDEKLNILDVGASAKLSILGGLVQASGSGRFISDKKRRTESVKVSIANLIKTEFEQINLAGHEERKLIDLEVLQKLDVTHVVVGIQWGGNVFISVEDSNSAGMDQQIVKGSLGGKLEMLFASVSLDGSVSLTDEELREYREFSFEVYGDVLPDNTPATLAQAVQLMKNSSRLLTEGNDGKGKAMFFELLPISVFRQLFNTQILFDSVLRSIDLATINSSIKLFEDLNVVEQKINDLMVDRTAFQSYITKEKSDNITAFVNDFEMYKNQIQQNFAEKLVAVRSGNGSLDQLLIVLQRARSHDLSPQNINFDQFKSVETEFRFLKLLQDIDVVLLAKEMTFMEFLSVNFNRNIYTFFYSSEYPTMMEPPMANFRHIVQKRETFDPSAVFLAIKIDVLSETERQLYFNFDGSTKLAVYRNGICVIENYDSTEALDLDDEPDLWSLHKMQTLINELREKTDKLALPENFTYVQYPHTPEPKDLWSQYNWTEITSSFSGAFFRADDDSKTFQKGVQTESFPMITTAERGLFSANSGDTRSIISFSRGKLTEPLLTGIDYRAVKTAQRAIRFYTSDNVVRPKHMTVKFWKRS